MADREIALSGSERPETPRPNGLSDGLSGKRVRRAGFGHISVRLENEDGVELARTQVTEGEPLEHVAERIQLAMMQRGAR